MESATRFFGSRPTPVTLLGNGHTITLVKYSPYRSQKAATEPRFFDSNNPLAIKGKGKDNPSNDVPGLLYVQGTQHVLRRNASQPRRNNYFGGGVTVQGWHVHMYGGTIENCGNQWRSMCYGGGGGVELRRLIHHVDGGEIKNCFATSPYKWADDGMNPR